MSKSYGYENSWVVSSVAVDESGVATEVDGFRMGTVHAKQAIYVPPGTVFPSVGAWVDAMDEETARRAPWAKKQHKLCSIAARSSVVWVGSAGHYMEVRRGDQTKFAAGERRTWATVEEWVDSLAPPPAVPVKEEPMSATPVLVVTEVAAPPAAKEETMEMEAPAPVPVVPVFDAEKFKTGFDGLHGWVKKQEGMLRSAGIIQLTEYLSRKRKAARAWLSKNPTWRYSARAIMQEYGWTAGHKEAKEAVTAFLEKF